MITSIKETVFIVLLALGFLSGLAIANVEILNPWGSQVAAASAEQQKEQEIALAELEYHYQQQKLFQETISYEQQLRDEAVYHQKRYEVWLLLERWLGLALITVVTMALCCGMVFLAARFWPKQESLPATVAYTGVPPPLTQYKHADLFLSPDPEPHPHNGRVLANQQRITP